MAATTRALLFVAVAAAAVLGTAHGASYTVGAPAGSWDLQTNYTTWASTITFRAGDQIVFKYFRASHNVLEVTKADYDSCSSSSPIKSFLTGDDTVPLPAAFVTRYFICGVPGHCDNGMKLTVRVEAAAAAAGPNAAAPSPTPFAMAPRRAAGPPMATPSAEAPAAGGRPAAALPPSSSAASSTGGVGSLPSLGLAAAVAALVALF